MLRVVTLQHAPTIEALYPLHSLNYESLVGDKAGISSIRIGNVVGIHEIIISSGLETITLKHEAHDRSLFADGAIKAAEFLIGKEPGLYEMKDMVK